MFLSHCELFNFVQGSDITGVSSFDIWKELNPEGTATEFLSQIRGKSAYELAKEGGYTGTEEEFADKLNRLMYGDIDIYTKCEPADDDIPKVFFNGVMPTTKDNVLAEMTCISKTLNFHCYIKIKCQGTSSMKYPKKNYTITLYEDEARTIKLKKNFRGWGNQNKFCLKANWIDISHARNVVSARIWGDIVKSRTNYNELPELLRTSPNQGAIDGFFIKVYYNGAYQGRYTWNMPKDKWMSNMDDSLDNHCILCGENYDSGCFRALPIIDESDWSDEIHDVVPESIKTRWTEVINFVMTSSDEEFKTNLNKYFDVHSLIDYHIFGLYMCGLDSYGKNQLFFTYDGKIWIISMYDCDSTWGLYWNGETLVAYNYARTKFEDMTNGRQGNLLFERLEQNFYEELQTRWAYLKNNALSLTNVINRFERFTDAVTSDLIKEDYASTTAGGKYSGIPSIAKNNIQQIRNFAMDRRSWTDNYLEDLAPIERISCTNITLSATELTFTGSGTQTLVATVEPSNTTDDITWVSDDDSIAIVVDGNVTAVNNGETTIVVTCGDYYASCTVSISGIEKPVIPDGDAVLYRLPGQTTFDGTNYIDTGICLLAEDKPFTLMIDWTHTGESEFVGSKYVVAHCMTEANPYPGLILQYGSAGLISEFRQDSSISSNSTGADIPNSDLYRAKVVYRKTEDGTVTISRCYNENGIVHTNTKKLQHSTVLENLRLGCYQTTLGGTGRFAKGIMNDCIVYNYALSDEDINTFLTSSYYSL